MATLPRYPVYVISKGRAERCLTARFLAKDGVPFHVVVEPQERDDYAATVGASRLLVLPFSNLGFGSIPARNWVWEHALASGAERHWILDDNMRYVRRLHHDGRRIVCKSGPAFAVVETFIDRYENVAIGGLAYQMFALPHQPPFFLNGHVYSCMLIRNDLPYRWRGRYNEDTDLCLQALAGGWCTVLVNAFMVDKLKTMSMKGGNTDELYQGDGQLKKAIALARQWPGVAKVTRRYGRPHHAVDWTKFTTRLRLKPGIERPPPELGLLRYLDDDCPHTIELKRRLVPCRRSNEHGLTLRRARAEKAKAGLMQYVKKAQMNRLTAGPTFQNAAPG